MTARFPQLIAIAKLAATVLVVLGIIWYQEHSLDGLRTDLIAELDDFETVLTAEINELRVAVANNGERMARIEDFLGTGTPDDPPQ